MSPFTMERCHYGRGSVLIAHGLVIKPSGCFANSGNPQSEAQHACSGHVCIKLILKMSLEFCRICLGGSIGPKLARTTRNLLEREQCSLMRSGPFMRFHN